MADGTYKVDPKHPVVRESLKQHAVRIAADALAPILDSAVARGLTRDEVVDIGKQALRAGGPESVLDRVEAALDKEIERRNA